MATVLPSSAVTVGQGRVHSSGLAPPPRVGQTRASCWPPGRCPVFLAPPARPVWWEAQLLPGRGGARSQCEEPGPWAGAMETEAPGLGSSSAVRVVMAAACSPGGCPWTGGGVLAPPAPHLHRGFCLDTAPHWCPALASWSLGHGVRLLVGWPGGGLRARVQLRGRASPRVLLGVAPRLASPWSPCSLGGSRGPRWG